MPPRNPNYPSEYGNNDVDLPHVEIKKKGMSLFKKVFIIVLVFLFCMGLLYIVGSAIQEGNLPGTSEKNQSVLPSDDIEEESSNTIAWSLIVLIVLIGLGVLLFYIFGRSNKTINIAPQKDPVTNDRAKDLFIEHFCKERRIMTVFDFKRKLFVPKNKEAVQIKSRVPFFHNPTGDNFWLFEFHVFEGSATGVHTALVPIDKGEETIKTGNYRLDEHTIKPQFRMMNRTFPMSSMIDKHDRMKMHVFENLDPDKITPDVINKMMPVNNSQASDALGITTPIDQYDREFPRLPPPNRPYQRRSYYPRKRYKYY